MLKRGRCLGLVGLGFRVCVWNILDLRLSGVKLRVWHLAQRVSVLLTFRFELMAGCCSLRCVFSESWVQDT